MILNIDVDEKSFGTTELYAGLQFSVQAGEKIGLIGRNGTGKSTLFGLIDGSDSDFQGDITLGRGIVVVSSRQEHHGFETMPVLDYIQGDLPEFAELHHIITNYPETMGDNPRKLQTYSDALERFTHLGYFQVEDELQQAFEDYQLDPALLEQPLSTLSGGQKRLVELVKVQRARAHLALIDEPTNHMDYRAKASFIKWLKSTEEAVLVISHDRDVLGAVDRIVEIRNKQAYVFRGDYKQYLSINKNQVTSEVNEYDVTQRRVKNLEQDVIRFRRLKERARDPDTIKRFKGQEQRASAELTKLRLVEKPSFWIDKDSAEDLNPKMTAAYQKYKAKNIQIGAKTRAEGTPNLLVQLHEAALSYGDEPLFKPVSFDLRAGERVRLHGRNGAGKTTIVSAILAKAAGTKSASTLLQGSLAVAESLSIGVYEQEIDGRFLPLTLQAGIEQALREHDKPVDDQQVKRLLAQYLFNPGSDGDKMISRLSGGQKARFQLIHMLMGEPSLLILDEPTNHLDLPSIEELEASLKDFAGAVIYISHDSYFADSVGGSTVTVAK